MTSPSTGRWLFVDTGGWAALINSSDHHHGEAQGMMRWSARRALVPITTNFIVAETHALLMSRMNVEVARTFVNRVGRTGITIERVTPGDERRAVAIINRYVDKAFSYTDATSFAVMERLGTSVALAFDRHFAQYGFRSPASQ